MHSLFLCSKLKIEKSQKDKKVKKSEVNLETPSSDEESENDRHFKMDDKSLEVENDDVKDDDDDDDDDSSEEELDISRGEGILDSSSDEEELDFGMVQVGSYFVFSAFFFSFSSLFCLSPSLSPPPSPSLSRLLSTSLSPPLSTFLFPSLSPLLCTPLFTALSPSLSPFLSPPLSCSVSPPFSTSLFR